MHFWHNCEEKRITWNGTRRTIQNNSFSLHLRKFFLYISTTYASRSLMRKCFSNWLCIHFIQRDYLTAIWCVSCIKGRQFLSTIWYYKMYLSVMVISLCSARRFHTTRDSYTYVLIMPKVHRIMCFRITHEKRSIVHEKNEF